MIVEQRTYTIKPLRTGDFLELYERAALPLQKKYLGHLVGFFTSEIGPLNQVVHIWVYDSLADRETRRATMDADPAWQAVKETNQGTFVAQDVKILHNTRFSPLYL